MNIKTKFDIDDTVYYLNDNVVNQALVARVKINITDSLGIGTEPFIDVVYFVRAGQLKEMPESKVFASKADLIASL